MLNYFPEMAVPSWLAGLTASSILSEPFPLQQVLHDSLYYPSSGFDGDPVKYLAGNILSFIHIDYGRSKEELLTALQHPGFRGYELIASRAVTQEELTPRGWQPDPPTRGDGDPTRYRAWIKEPFCLWSIFQRGENLTAAHGPVRFSLLHLGADGVAAFQALYLANAARPKAVAVIQPGHGFGGNWTNFADPGRIFARTVLGNPQGRPDILLYGGIGRRAFYEKPCWPDYSQFMGFLAKAGGGSIGLWRENTR